MNLHRYISECIITYPNLYYHNTFKRSQLEVLDDTFNVIGNDMTWHKETGTMIELRLVDNKEFTSEGWTCWGKTNELSCGGEIITSDNFDRITKKLLYDIKPSTSEFTPYSILHKGALHHLPDNIEKSWLEGANIIYDTLYEFYSKGLNDKRNHFLYKDRGKVDNIKQLNLLEVIRERLNVLEYRGI